MQKIRLWLVPAAAVLLVGSVVAVYPSVQFSVRSLAQQMGDSGATKGLHPNPEKPQPAATGMPTADTIYQRVNPAVVTIYGADGIGSGIVLRSGGLLLTSKHTVSNSATVRVKTTNAQTYEGKVVDFDLQHDLALIKLQTQDLQLPTVALATVTVAKGDRVYAIGSPAGQAGTMTTGSFLNVTDQGSLRLSAGLLSPGNSGGPVISANGEVIGINKGLLPDKSGLATPAIAAKKLVERFDTVNGTRP